MMAQSVEKRWVVLGADPGISGGGWQGRRKINRGMEAAVGTQRSPGAEPLVGVKAKPPKR
jgi:hypothetical protein